MDTMVELVDIAPTLLEAIGQPYRKGMQGKSLWDLLIDSNEEDSHRDDVYCEFYDDGRGDDKLKVSSNMLRTEKFKLVVYSGMEHGELYDMKEDPNESSNSTG